MNSAESNSQKGSEEASVDPVLREGWSVSVSLAHTHTLAHMIDLVFGECWTGPMTLEKKSKMKDILSFSNSLGNVEISFDNENGRTLGILTH